MIIDKHVLPKDLIRLNIMLEIISIYDDIFELKTEYIGEYCFLLNIKRLDKNTGWGQNLQITANIDNQVFYIHIGSSEENSIKREIISPYRINILENKNNKIPKKIFQSYASNDIAPNMHRAITTWRVQNPDYEHIFFDDKDCEEFIKNNFNDKVWRAYDSLIPPAFKCDIWRLCVLYMYGGIYADISMECLKPIDEIIDEGDNLIVVRDTPTNLSYIYQAFIAAEPKNPSIYRILNFTIDRVNNKEFEKTKRGGINSLSITGPYVFAYGLNLSLEKQLFKNFLIGTFDYDDIIFKILDFKSNKIVYNQKEYIKTKYENWGNDRVTEHYSKSVKMGKIYKF